MEELPQTPKDKVQFERLMDFKQPTPSTAHDDSHTIKLHHARTLSNTYCSGALIQSTEYQEHHFRQPDFGAMSPEPRSHSSSLIASPFFQSSHRGTILSSASKLGLMRRQNSRKKTATQRIIPTFQEIDKNIENKTNHHKFKCLIQLDGKFKSVWEALNMLFLIATFIYVPLRLTFNSDTYEPTPGIQVMERMMDAFFLADLILNFFTPFYNDVELIRNHCEIAKQYLKFWFWIDLISILPFDDIASLMGADSLGVFSKSARILKVLRLFKFMRAFRLRKGGGSMISKFFDWLGMSNTIRALIPSTAVIVILIHLCACLWQFVGAVDDTGMSWIRLGHFEDEPPFDNYITSTYFVVQTFTTVGYGDIASKTSIEIIVRIGLIFIGTFVYSAFTGEIMDYKSKEMAKAESDLIRMNMLESLKNNGLINEQLFLCVKEAIENQDKNKSSAQTAGDEPKLDKLDLENLVEDETVALEYNIYREEYMKIPLCRASEHSEYILGIGRAVKRKKVEEGQVIYSAGEAPAVFNILVSGEVGLMGEVFTQIPFVKIKKGYFGEFEILRDLPRLYTATALTNCELLQLSVKDFKKIFAEGPDSMLSDVFYDRAWERQVRFEKAHEMFQAAAHNRLARKLPELYSNIKEDNNGMVEISGSLAQVNKRESNGQFFEKENYGFPGIVILNNDESMRRPSQYPRHSLSVKPTPRLSINPNSHHARSSLYVRPSVPSIQEFEPETSTPVQTVVLENRVSIVEDWPQNRTAMNSINASSPGSEQQNQLYSPGMTNSPPYLHLTTPPDKTQRRQMVQPPDTTQPSHREPPSAWRAYDIPKQSPRPS
jgi:hypothetical protein